MRARLAWSRSGWLLLFAAMACGGAHHTGGAAGAPAHQPGLGDPCQGACTIGLMCEHVGIFAGLCTASCTSDPACGLLNTRSVCYGTANGECGVPCTLDTECPMGTHCVQLGTLGSQRACELSH
jgi:hypothetical protein